MLGRGDGRNGQAPRSGKMDTPAWLIFAVVAFAGHCWPGQGSSCIADCITPLCTSTSSLSEEQTLVARFPLSFLAAGSILQCLAACVMV